MGTQVRFYEDAYKNPQKSAEAGRPVFDTVDWCEVRVLGEPDTISGPVHKMQPDPRERFPRAWEQYQRDKSTEGLTGTLLKHVTWLEKGEVETLHHAGIKTLENLASVADSAITRIPGGLVLRQKARDLLKASASEAPLQQMSEELAKRDAEIASLKTQIQEILAAKQRRSKES